MTVLRTDWGVILARGESRRMGRPKGLCRLAGRSETFLAGLLKQYRSRLMPVAVVTTASLKQIYADALGDEQPRRWLTGPSGDGTARSVQIALKGLAQDGSHLWIHPVDVPLVSAPTLDHLARQSAQSPDAVIVPHCGDRPGHPVILPTTLFADMSEQEARGRMRDVILARADSVLNGAASLVTLAVTDDGVIRDFDEAEDIEMADAQVNNPGEKRND